MFALGFFGLPTPSLFRQRQRERCPVENSSRVAKLVWVRFLNIVIWRTEKMRVSSHLTTELRFITILLKSMTYCFQQKPDSGISTTHWKCVYRLCMCVLCRTFNKSSNQIYRKNAVPSDFSSLETWKPKILKELLEINLKGATKLENDGKNNP